MINIIIKLSWDNGEAFDCCTHCYSN